MQVPLINLRELFQVTGSRHLKAPQIVAEHISIPSLYFCLIQCPVRILKKLLIRIAGYILREVTDPDTAGNGESRARELNLPDRFDQLPHLLRQRFMRDILHKNHKLIAASSYQNILFLKKSAQKTGERT